MKNHNPFRYFKTSPEIIGPALMIYVRFPLSFRNVEDLLHERDIGICHKTVRYWWKRFDPLFRQITSSKFLVCLGAPLPPLSSSVSVADGARR